MVLIEPAADFFWSKPHLFDLIVLYATLRVVGYTLDQLPNLVWRLIYLLCGLTNFVRTKPMLQRFLGRTYEKHIPWVRLSGSTCGDKKNFGCFNTGIKCAQKLTVLFDKSLIVLAKIVLSGRDHFQFEFVQKESKEQYAATEN